MTAAAAPLASTTLGQAAEDFLHRRDLDADTLRSYGQTLTQLRAALSDGVLLGSRQQSRKIQRTYR